MGNIATAVTVVRALDGPQLVITWTNPVPGGPAFQQVMVRRGLVDWPITITAGEQIYNDATPPTEGATIMVSDTAVVGQQAYYYTVFTKIAGTWYYDSTTQRKIVAHDNSDFHARLWSGLPEVYRVRDSETGQAGLTLTTGSDGAKWNINDDQTVTFGQLYRFLKVFGLQVGQIREFIKYFGQFYSAQNVDSGILPHLASLIGLTLISGTTLTKQRFLIDNAVDLYKIRGTMAGVARFVDGNFSASPLYVEFRNNVLETNDVNKTVLDFDDIVFADMGGPWETVDYVLDFTSGAQWSYRALGLFFETLKSDITTTMLDTAEAYLAEFLPGTVNWLAWAHWDTLNMEDDFDDFVAWVETDPQSVLAATSGYAVYTHPAAMALGSASLSQTAAVVVGTEFGIEIDFQDFSKPVGAGAVGTFTMTVYLNVGLTYYIQILLEYDHTAGTLKFKSYKSDSAGVALVAEESIAVTVTDGILRMERGPDGLIRFIVSADGGATRTLLGEYLSTDFITANYWKILLEWACPNFEMSVKHDRIEMLETSIGWEKIHP